MGERWQFRKRFCRSIASRQEGIRWLSKTACALMDRANPARREFVYSVARNVVVDVVLFYPLET